MTVQEVMEARGGIGGLSCREAEVLELMAQGYSNDYIGRQLVVSPRTIETHVRSIFRKLGIPEHPGVHRRVVATVAYLSARN